MKPERASAPDAPPELLRIQRAIEGGLAAFILLGSLAVFWLNQRAVSGLPAPPQGEETLGRLQGIAEEPLGQLVGALVVVVLLGGLVAAALLGPRMLRALVAALRGPQPRPRLSLAHFLVAFGALNVGSLVVVMSLGGPAPAFEVTAAPEGAALPGGGRWPPEPEGRGSPTAIGLGGGLRFGGEGLAIPGAAGPVAELRWAQLTGWLETFPVPDGAAVSVRVDGEPVAAGQTVEVPPGAALRVGPWGGRLQAPGALDQVRTMSLARAAGLALIVAGCLVLGGLPLLRELGLTTEGLGDEVLRGVAAYLAFVPIYALALVLTQLLLRLLDLPPAGHSLVRALERQGLGLAGWIVFQAVVLAPVAEEVVFRGFLVPGFRRLVGAGWAILLAGLVFGCVHEGLPSFLPMLALGGLFSALLVTSPRGSLVGAITAHALHNGLTLAVVLLVLAGGQG